MKVSITELLKIDNSHLAVCKHCGKLNWWENEKCVDCTHSMTFSDVADLSGFEAFCSGKSGDLITVVI